LFARLAIGALLLCRIPATAQTSTPFDFTFTGNLSSAAFSGSGPIDPYGTGSISLSFPTAPKMPSLISIVVGSGDIISAQTTSFAGGIDVAGGTATITGGTGQFANATGSFSFLLTVGTGGTTFTGNGTIITGGNASTPFPVPGSPEGPGPEGDPTGVNCISCGQPVTISNGNMYHQFTDATLKGSGFPIVLTRTYNSQSGVDSIFGTGWTHSYQRWLNPNGSSVVYYNESGGAYTFTQQGSGFAPPPGVYLTLSKTTQGTYQLQTLSGGAMTFDTSGRLTALTDANGNAQTIAYNSQGRIATVSDGIGESLAFSYDSNNHATSVQDHTGRNVTYQFGSNGVLSASTDPAGATTSYSYSATGGLLQTIGLPDGGAIHYTYGSNGQVSQVVDRESAASAYTYSPAQTVVQDELGRNTTFQFNSAGNVTKQINPDSTSRLQAFDPNTDLTSMTDAIGAVTGYQYDTNGNLLKRIDALGETRTFTHDPAFNHVTSLQDADGNVTQYQYDSKGNLTKVIDALGGQTTYTYDFFGNILTTTDAGRRNHHRYL